FAGGQFIYTKYFTLSIILFINIVNRSIKNIYKKYYFEKDKYFQKPFHNPHPFLH
ncbi:hypothetical protein HMPREF1373_02798, partial [Enterococcus faecium P1140]